LEISKFIQDAFKDGSIEKVSNGIEQLVMMMINAIGMIERRELEFEKRIETLEEDIDLIKSFLLSKPIPLPGSTVPPQTISPPSETRAPPITPLATSSPPSRTTPSPPSLPQPPSAADSQLSPTQEPELPHTEDDIRAFRQQLLKPAPLHEKPKAEPISIRAALMEEMKEYFGTALKKVQKDQKPSD
jgi:hypothetical protein